MSNLITLPSGNIIDKDRIILVAKTGINEFKIVLAGAGAADISDEDYESIKTMITKEGGIEVDKEDQKIFEDVYKGLK